jgi:hypothetical protein
MKKLDPAKYDDSSKWPKEHIITNGEKGRRFGVFVPHHCLATWKARGVKGPGVGYISATDGDGNGFTIWIESEEVFAMAQKILGPLTCDELRDGFVINRVNSL